MTAPDSSDTLIISAAYGERGWALRELPDRASDSLDSLVEYLREARDEGAVIGFVCVDDDWAAVVRPVPGGVRILISDATAALDDYLATDMLDELGVDTPTEEEAEEADESDSQWPEGEFDLLEDLGVSEQLISVVMDDPELYPSDQLLSIAEELGFDEELAELLGVDG